MNDAGERKSLQVGDELAWFGGGKGMGSSCEPLLFLTRFVSDLLRVPATILRRSGFVAQLAATSFAGTRRIF